MRSTTRRTVPYRRKREGKTNYKKRLELLKGRVDRLVIRKTNKHIILQIVRYDADGDKIMAAVTSRKLESLGWKHSGKNLPAAYLTGILLAQKAKEHKITQAIADLGLQSPSKGSKLYAALKGAIDAGLEVKAGEDIFPPIERLSGKHINTDISASFEKIKTTLLKGAAK